MIFLSCIFHLQEFLTSFFLSQKEPEDYLKKNRIFRSISYNSLKALGRRLKFVTEWTFN